MQPLGAVEQEVKSELEFELLVTAGADAGEVALRGSRCDGEDVRVPLGELAGHCLQRLRAEGLRRAAFRLVEHLGAEPPDAVAQGVHDVMREIGGEAAGAEAAGH